MQPSRQAFVPSARRHTMPTPDSPVRVSRPLAIAAIDTTGHEIAVPVAPCGACRQALTEYEKLAGHDVEVILVGAGEIYVLPSVASTLPLTFREF